MNQTEIFTRDSPNIYKYLLSNKENLGKREYFNKSKKAWFELWNPRKISHFQSRKFVFSEIGLTNDFILVDECYYMDSACGAELKTEYKIFENYFKLYLNSKLATYIFKKISVPKANGYSIYKNSFLKSLPVVFSDIVSEHIDRFEFMSQDEFNNYLYNLVELNMSEITIVEEFYNKLVKDI